MKEIHHWGYKIRQIYNIKHWSFKSHFVTQINIIILFSAIFRRHLTRAGNQSLTLVTTDRTCLMIVGVLRVLPVVKPVADLGIKSRVEVIESATLDVWCTSCRCHVQICLKTSWYSQRAMTVGTIPPSYNYCAPYVPLPCEPEWVTCKSIVHCTNVFLYFMTAARTITRIIVLINKKYFSLACTKNSYLIP